MSRKAGVMIARTLGGAVAAVGVLVVFTCLTVAPARAAGEGCPNEELRVEQDAQYLPDCRAYELVSPRGTIPGGEEVMAAAGGGGVSWFSYYPPSSGGEYGGFYRSVRGVDGWSSEGVIPPQSVSSRASFSCAPSMYFSAELSVGVLIDGLDSSGAQHGAGAEGSEEGFCGRSQLPLVSDEPVGWQNEPEGFQNLFVRQFGTSSYRLVNRTPTGVLPGNAYFQAGSTEPGEEFSHVVFTEQANLTGDAPAGQDLYEWNDGTVRLVSYLPDGQPVLGMLANGGYPKMGGTFRAAAVVTHAVSRGGSTVFFTAEGKLFARMNAERSQSVVAGGGCTEPEGGCTVQVDASQAGGSGGGGTFLAANAEGTRAFLVDGAEAKLTESTQPGSGVNLYVYDLPEEKLRDLTAVAHAEVLGLSGLSEDGSTIYFVAKGALAEGATAGQPNLYVATNTGTIAFIATLNDNPYLTDQSDWGDEAYSLAVLHARVSPNGEFFLFQSTESLTGYDNMPVEPAQCRNGIGESAPCSELFLYDAVTRTLSCVSCDPDGARPTAPAETYPLAIMGNAEYEPGYPPRYVLNDGRVFFNSSDPLLPERDVNGQRDVYEYYEGRLSLISSGTSPDRSEFVDASENGEDVFFLSAQNLVGAADGTAYKLYDARVGGGFEGGAGVVEGEACGSGDGCRSPLTEPPVQAFPASGVTAGAGDLVSRPEERRPVVEQHKAKRVLTRAQRLAAALEACRKRKVKKKRVACEAGARARYGAKAKAKAKKRGGHASGNGAGR